MVTITATTEVDATMTETVTYETQDGPGAARAATPPPAAETDTRFLRPAVRRTLMIVAAIATGAAIFFPLWGLTLASIQYPEGLRMVVYPTRITGDVLEINMLNGYIGMAKISRDFFVELRIMPYLLAGMALLTFAMAFVRKAWLRVLPLVGLASIAVYGLRSMAQRMYDYGHDLDPMAPIEIEPFTPPMFGENQIAQFGTYAYFSWGTFLPLIAGLLIAVVVWADIRDARAKKAPRSDYQPGA